MQRNKQQPQATQSKPIQLAVGFAAVLRLRDGALTYVGGKARGWGNGADSDRQGCGRSVRVRVRALSHGPERGLAAASAALRGRLFQHRSVFRRVPADDARSRTR